MAQAEEATFRIFTRRPWSIECQALSLTCRELVGPMSPFPGQPLKIVDSSLCSHKSEAARRSVILSPSQTRFLEVPNEAPTLFSHVPIGRVPRNPVEPLEPLRQAPTSDPGSILALIMEIDTIGTTGRVAYFGSFQVFFFDAEPRQRCSAFRHWAAEFWGRHWNSETR
ncbi:hypothetical protein VTI74DRAFT_2617 [Chaetomium olivicolor]